jgi:phosphoribosylformylglycinamidine cyclo-ligase
MSDETKGTPRRRPGESRSPLLRPPGSRPARPSAGEKVAAHPVSARPAVAARSLTYKDAGVDIDAKARAIQRIKMIARGTFRKGVLSDIGSFGGLYELAAAGSFRNPVLVSSTDGVGTKLKVAILAKNHRTIGADLVHHCINDILVQGAVPLFFLDYIAMGKLQADVLLDVTAGLARGCRDSGCALIGGETAEMPDLYRPGEYDLAGFIVGVVEKEHIINGSRIAVGDVLIGLPSSGLHTNGYSLARKILFEQKRLRPESRVPELARTVGEELLAIHRSYLQVMRGLIPTGAVYGMAHITGGGFTENIPRILPRGVSARIDLGTWPVPPLFGYLQREGRIAGEEMLRTFNMGIGLVLVVPLHRESEVVKHLETLREKSYRIGEIVRGNRKVEYSHDAATTGGIVVGPPLP